MLALVLFERPLEMMSLSGRNSRVILLFAASLTTSGMWLRKAALRQSIQRHKPSQNDKGAVQLRDNWPELLAVRHVKHPSIL